MKVLLLVTVITAFGLLEAYVEVWNIQKMIKAIAGKDAAIFDGYGCNCGMNRKGRAMDQVDRCCIQHSCCYRRPRKFGCSLNNPTYRVDIYGDEPVCDKTNDCEYLICRCDKEFANCLRRRLHNFNTSLEHYDKCSGDPPSC